MPTNRIFLAYTHGVILAFCKGVNGGAEHVFHGAGLLFLGKDNGQLQQVAYHDGRGDAAGLHGDDLIDTGRGKTAHEFYGHGAHQAGIHLVVDKAIHFENVPRETLAIFDNSVFQRLHGLIQYVAVRGRITVFFIPDKHNKPYSESAHTCPKDLGHVDLRLTIYN